MCPLCTGGVHLGPDIEGERRRRDLAAAGTLVLGFRCGEGGGGEREDMKRRSTIKSHEKGRGRGRGGGGGTSARWRRR